MLFDGQRGEGRVGDGSGAAGLSRPSAAAGGVAGWPRRGWRDRLVVVLTGPAVLRPVTSVLRRVAPVLRVGKRVLVTDHAGVTEVLGRDQDFTVAAVNQERMERWSGSFILGMDRGEAYDREVAALRRAASVDDLERIRALVRTAAADQIEQARPTGRIDVVGGFARIVATRVVADYFGAPGHHDESTMRWMRAMFDAVFLDDSPRARQAAALAVAEQRPYMEALISARRAAVTAGEPVADDVLTRLVSMGSEEPWLDDEAVRRNLNGLIVGALDTTSKAVTHAVYELLRHPGALREAREAAVAGDIETVRRCAWEALRFRPHSPILQRHCAADTTLGARGKRVPAGAWVWALAGSAMFDRSAFPRPRQLRSDRPDDRYVHFGHGLHACFGRHINAVQVPELVAALVRLPGLRRAPGADGRITYDGPFPDRLIVEFDADQEGQP